MRAAILSAALLTLVAHGTASADPEPTEDTVTAADEAGVDLTSLLGAMATTGMDARSYLLRTGELPQGAAAPPSAGAVDAGGGPYAASGPILSGRLACIARVESRNDPNATNPRSGAAGLFQFLLSTWMTTPQGKAGYSRYDPVVATAAADWMLRQGRAREWVAVSGGWC